MILIVRFFEIIKSGEREAETWTQKDRSFFETMPGGVILQEQLRKAYVSRNCLLETGSNMLGSEVYWLNLLIIMTLK